MIGVLNAKLTRVSRNKIIIDRGRRARAANVVIDLRMFVQWMFVDCSRLTHNESVTK